MYYSWFLIAKIVLGCPSYKYDESLSPGTCYETSGDAISMNNCPEGYYCKQSPPIGECAEGDEAKIMFPGEECDIDRYLLCLGQCESGKCKGKPEGSSCNDHFDCDIGLACFSYFCKPQLKIGESGCINMYQCENSGFCHDGKCVLYYSIESGQKPPDVCFGFHNSECISGICDGTNCISYPETLTLEKKECRDDSGICIYKTDTGQQILVQCRCQFDSDTQSECGPFFNEEYQKDYQKLLKMWVTGDSVKKCHTQSRYISKCMEKYEPEIYQKLRTYYMYILKDIKVDGKDMRLIEAAINDSCVRP